MTDTDPRTAAVQMTRGRLSSAYVQVKSLLLALVATVLTLVAVNANKHHAVSYADLLSIFPGFLLPLGLSVLLVVAIVLRYRLILLDIRRLEKRAKRLQQERAATRGILRKAWYSARVGYVHMRISRYNRDADSYDRVVGLLEDDPRLCADVSAYLATRNWKTSLLLPSVLIAVSSVLITSWLTP